MAKYERRIKGDFDSILSQINTAIISGSRSANYEDGGSYVSGAFRCAVRVYERYSFFGGNRLCMTVMLAGTDGEYLLTVITAGGSEGIFFKVNTVGEKSFLKSILPTLERL